MLQPVLAVCAVITVGSLITIGIVAGTRNGPVDARGNHMSQLDPVAVEQVANEPCITPHLMTSL